MRENADGSVTDASIWCYNQYHAVTPRDGNGHSRFSTFRSVERCQQVHGQRHVVCNTYKCDKKNQNKIKCIF